MTCLNLQTMNELVACCLPAFGSKHQPVPASGLLTCECKHVATSSSLEPRLFVPGLVWQLWRISPSSVRQNPGRRAWIRGYIPLQLKTSCQNQSVLETSCWWDSVSSFDIATATESFAAAAKGGLLIPAISSSPPVSVNAGYSWTQYSFYKYIADNL